jgi:hypothetical protein
MDHEQLARSESRNVSMADPGADDSLAASVRAGSGPGRARVFGALAIGALAIGRLAVGLLGWFASREFADSRSMNST